MIPTHMCPESADDSNELETCRRPREEREGVPDENLDDIMLEMRDVKSELLHVRALLGVLVRTEKVRRHEDGACGQKTGQDGSSKG